MPKLITIYRVRAMVPNSETYYNLVQSVVFDFQVGCQEYFDPDQRYQAGQKFAY